MDVADVVGNAGDHVVVEAVPGAGKTHMIVQLALKCDAPLILAYNNALASDIQSRVDSTTVMCFTFHGLCSRYIRLVRDDLQLRAALDDVDCGNIHVEEFPFVDSIFVDEAQDVRPVYIRLLRTLGLLARSNRVYVFGDRNQLIYDFDNEFPACLDVLTKPNLCVLRGVKWKRIVASVSNRLPTSVARLVSDLFHVSITTSGNPGLAVDVRVPETMFKLSKELDDLKHVPHLLLVDRKRNNRPLHVLLNDWSREGVVMNVHNDTQPTDDATLTCATYWSAKGLQHDTVVVLVPEQTPRNPLYVALTRALRRLIIVIEPKEPHVALCHALSRNSDVVTMHSRAAQVVHATLASDPTLSLSGRKEFGRATVPPPNYRMHEPRIVPAMFLQEDDAMEDHTIIDMALTWIEMRTTGICRRVEEIRSPCYLKRDKAMELRKYGFVGRVYSASMSDDMLLATDLRETLFDAYDALQTQALDTLTDIVFQHIYTVCVMKGAHYGMECNARQRPAKVVATSSDCERMQWIADAISDATVFDVPGASWNERIQAKSTDCTYLVVSQQTSEDVTRAAMQCGAQTCVLVDVDAQTLTSIAELC